MKLRAAVRLQELKNEGKNSDDCAKEEILSEVCVRGQEAAGPMGLRRFRQGILLAGSWPRKLLEAKKRCSTQLAPAWKGEGKPSSHSLLPLRPCAQPPAPKAMDAEDLLIPTPSRWE